MPLNQNEIENVKGYWKFSGTVGDLGQEISFYNEQEGESREIASRSSDMLLNQNEIENVKGYWRFSGTVGALGQEISFYNEQEGESREIAQRFFCHFLISGLPSQGLEEALETLADILQFHLQPPPPARFRLKSQEQETQPKIAKVGKTIPRPELIIDG